jgi:hypothetical protein
LRRQLHDIFAGVPKRFLPSDILWMNGVHEKMRAARPPWLPDAE